MVRSSNVESGYDHISSVIGDAIAAVSGASFLCYATPAEHLGLSNAEDVKEGFIAVKIAAHSGVVPFDRDFCCNIYFFAEKKRLFLYSIVLKIHFNLQFDML